MLMILCVNFLFLDVVVMLLAFITGSIARSATCWYLIYSEADFEVFRPAGATLCTDGATTRV